MKLDANYNCYLIARIQDCLRRQTQRPDKLSQRDLSRPSDLLLLAGLLEPMSKRIKEPNSTLYPVSAVLITVGGPSPNVMNCNRIASCSAEPPRLEWLYLE